MIRSLAIVLPNLRFSFRLCHVAPTKNEICNQNGSDLLRKLAQEFTDTSFISPELTKEKFAGTNFEEWKDCVYVLKNFNFKDSECFTMINKCPSLIKMPKIDLLNALKKWNTSTLGTKNLHRLLLSNPNLLLINLDVIDERLPYLISQVKSKISITDLIINCPNILYDDWQSILNKINFLMEEKGLKWGEILQSKVLSKPLDFIKLRIDVLEKCGMYKVNNVELRKQSKHKLSYKNPHLKKIVDFDDCGFSNIARITLEEYYACKELFSLEEDFDSDSDDDLKTSYLRKK